VRRLVEAVELLDLLHLRRVDALPAAVAAGAGRRGGRGRAATLEAPFAPLQLRHHLLDRSAGNELHDDEGDEDDAEQRRDHEQQALEDVGPHYFLLHQVVTTQSSAW